jgi:SAM-dependent methyltransferase
MKDEWHLIKEEILNRILDEGNFVRAVFSGRRRHYQPSVERIDIKPVLLKGKMLLQVNYLTGVNSSTENLNPNEFEKSNLLEKGFANFLIETRTESLQVRIGKKGQVFSKTSRAELEPNYDHDKRKRRILNEDDPFLRAVGITDSTGKVKPSMRDKYLQVDEFLKVLERSTERLLESKKELRLVDLGCGHAYLTFAAYRYFQLNGRKVKFVGVDIRESSRVRNQEIAQKFGIADDVTFIANEISDFDGEKFDVAIALHACDTATDDALAWAINNEVEIILAAPCCHYDLHRQVKRFPKDVEILAYDGILANRQLDLITDELRAQILRLMGYKTDVFEFISGDHTARNLMIRAIWSKEPGRDKKLSEYRHICQTWGIAPALEARLKLGAIPASD